MNSLQMQYFLTVSKYLSFTRAARELYVSQPSVSKQIAALEGELGFALFDRSQKHGLQLTRAGVIFADLFQRITAEMECAIQTAVRLNGELNGKLRVCLVEGWDLSNFLGRILRFFQAEYPHIQLTFETRPVQELLFGLQNGRFDAAICMSAPTRTLRELSAVPLADLPGILFFSARHPLAGKPDIQPNDFKGYPLCLLPPGEEPAGQAEYLDYFHSQGMEPLCRELPNRDSVLLAVDTQNAFSITLPWSRVLNSSCYRYIYTGISIPVSLIWNPRTETPMHRIFAEKLSELFCTQAGMGEDDVLRRVRAPVH